MVFSTQLLGTCRVKPECKTVAHRSSWLVKSPSFAQIKQLFGLLKKYGFIKLTHFPVIIVGSKSKAFM
jgi:hypothetical protein